MVPPHSSYTVDGPSSLPNSEPSALTSRTGRSTTRSRFSLGRRSSRDVKLRKRLYRRPRRVLRWVVLSLLALVFFLLARRVYERRWARSRRRTHNGGYFLKGRSLSSKNGIDYTWGSLLHRYHNHPDPVTPRVELPWKKNPRLLHPDRTPTRALIVTSELAGLHKNGGIGTAFRELATALASSAIVNVDILIANRMQDYPMGQVRNLTRTLADQEINLHFVEEEPQPFWPTSWSALASRQILAFLQAHDNEWDVIHFPDNTGIGYFPTLARQQGLMLQNTRIVVGLHGADVEWATILNKLYPQDKFSFQKAEFERRTVEMADVAIAPSEYMLDYLKKRGWKLPQHAFVIPNIVGARPLPNVNRRLSSESGGVHPVNELVFFGRLEERKGTRLFLETLELLFERTSSIETPTSITKITFLGRDFEDSKSHIDASALISNAMDALRDHSDVDLQVQFLRDYDREQGLVYITDPRRLVVLPALIDNSPSTVLECIAYGARFIASDVGGIPELVHPADHSKVLFAPRATPFAHKIAQEVTALRSTAWPKIRPRPETVTATEDWVNFHDWIMSIPTPSKWKPAVPSFAPRISIIVTHYERAGLVTQMLDSIVGQTRECYEVIFVDDGSKKNSTLAALADIEARYFAPRSNWHFVTIENSYLGEARNRGAALAKGNWLLFLDDDDVLKPHYLETVIQVAGRTGAKALSTWLDEFASDMNPLFTTSKVIPNRRTYWFLGSGMSLGLITNSFGSGNVFVERTVFEDLGGFSTSRELGAEDWQFWTRLTLKGYKHLAIPEELIWVRSDPARESMKFSMDPWEANYHALAPLLADKRVQEMGLAHLLMYAKSEMDRPLPIPRTADSSRDFEFVQGWQGWYYSFIPVGKLPTVDPQYHAEAFPEDGSWGVDRAASQPYLSALGVKPYIDTRGVRYAAVKIFKSPKELDVVAEMKLQASHHCGDGTEVTFASRIDDSMDWTVHAKINTMNSRDETVRVDLQLVPGSLVAISVDPLETDECDAIDIDLGIMQAEINSRAWSSIAKRNELIASAKSRNERLEQDRVRQEQLAKEAAESPVPTADDEGGDSSGTELSLDAAFNIALVFDANRVDQAKQVIRSAIKFLTSRPSLHFHLVTPPKLHDELREFFADSGHGVSTYDHGLCAKFAAAVLPFSDEDIHISAHCKMFLSKIITHAEKVLYLDTDVTVLSDLSSCYAESDDQRVLLKMGIDMGDACQLYPDRCWPIALHWRVPEGLECGNIPQNNSPDHFDEHAYCASAHEIETVQVNGGVALMRLDRMREAAFTDRYVRTVARTYRSVGRRARWGEQDFINSYIRMFPEDFELLPCGCNYQWLGRRKEVKCASQPIAIAHHWSMGIEFPGMHEYNDIYFDLLAANETAANAAESKHKPFPPITSSHLSSPKATDLELLFDPNCPSQSHDCINHKDIPDHYGERVFVLSRIVRGTFVQDFYDSFDQQTYPNRKQFVVAQEGVTLPPAGPKREVLSVTFDLDADRDRLCHKCGHLAATDPGLTGAKSCSLPPLDPIAKKRYWDCACGAADSTAPLMYDLDALVIDENSRGWVLYLDDDKLFADRDSIAHLMAQIDTENDLIVFRANTTANHGVRFDLGKRMIARSEMDTIGFLFHSSHLGKNSWTATRCSMWETFSRLSRHSRVKWIDLVPVINHPLRHHLIRPKILSHDLFGSSVVVLETLGGLTQWTEQIVLSLLDPSQAILRSDVSMLTVDVYEKRPYARKVKIRAAKAGRGLSQISTLGTSPRVLILADSVRLDKVSLDTLDAVCLGCSYSLSYLSVSLQSALTSLLTYALDEPDRLVGLFTETAMEEFSPPLDVDPETFRSHLEQNPMPGITRYTHLLPRAMMVSRAHLKTLTHIHHARPLPAQCHPLLLSAIAYNASGQPPLRILPPPGSVVDHVYNCRRDGFYDTTYGFLPGDDPAPSMKQLQDPEFVLPDHTLADCLRLVNHRMGWDYWKVWSEHVGTTSAFGARAGIVRATEISQQMWEAILKEEKCERNPKEKWVRPRLEKDIYDEDEEPDLEALQGQQQYSLAAAVENI
ncbi:BZ3500_MvSof-1268-A1-R1_Chr9g10596 [Microbotryum saponariae]|uniref:BZ3500_MvSof-1268-A1-R1_Chr9g10596 protein n=1 Tax=Microbotryum saponariae TaxID=289078 RepID=A0A2X0K9E8_9BASI|nr:BZ3501_MvSof-1269-A2-R1_Chr9g10344 [Microbotryum saponariae]SDA00360.1 BZ3500_MvSof-1268-A1-R1_Chr9g10596 [Microbotryum saponariae]